MILYSDANLQLLFTVVENAPSETVRSNCTVALGDLAVRFPNLLEPWTEHMYARLRDPSVSVRKNAVLVLSHLILNDMMKVRGTNLQLPYNVPCAHVFNPFVAYVSIFYFIYCVQVKGYINEMTICLEDEDERISSLAKLFFNELSKKGNISYPPVLC